MKKLRQDIVILEKSTILQVSVEVLRGAEHCEVRVLERVREDGRVVWKRVRDKEESFVDRLSTKERA